MGIFLFKTLLKSSFENHNNMEITSITTVCLIQIIESNVGVLCERCNVCCTPGRTIVRMVCSCGCGALKQVCSRCPLGFIPRCIQEEKKRQEEKKQEKQEEEEKKAYKERKFMCS